MTDKPKSLAAGLAPLPKRALYADATPKDGVMRTIRAQDQAASAKRRAKASKAITHAAAPKPRRPRKRP